jgi:hypothetical protein
MHRKQQKVLCSPVENDYQRLLGTRPIRSETERLWPEDELAVGIIFHGYNRRDLPSARKLDHSFPRTAMKDALILRCRLSFEKAVLELGLASIHVHSAIAGF